MPVKFIILAVISVIDVIFAVVLFYRNPKNYAVRAYTAFLFFVCIWGLSTVLYLISGDLNGWGLFWMRAGYYAAIGIAISFLIFSTFFPHPSFLWQSLDILLLTMWSLTVFYLSGSSGLIVKALVSTPRGNEQLIDTRGHFLFMLYFIPIILWSFIHLYKKYRMFEGVNKTQLKYVIGGNIVAFSFGMLFNLILPHFAIYNLMWLGPCFTLTTIIATSYLVFVRLK